ncbi:MAG: GNAT family N-acetyltransferase [Desulfamplus sp.]|nr:GNAT family N-acetyltransferase [Desulfamplus sp.]
MKIRKSVVWNNETLIIRKYNHERDEANVLQLWRAAFNNQMPPSLWQWKYIENPYRTAIMICENSKSLPVVFYGGVPFASTCCGRQIVMIHLSDIMSHPDYRGSGLFIHTANAYFDTFGSVDDICIMYGFPGKFHFDIGAKYLQYSPLGSGAAFFKAESENIKKFKQIVSGTIALFPASDPCFDYIWKNLSTIYPLSVVRDSAYMAWRYFKHPVRKYEVWCYKGLFHKEWQAFVVIQIKDEVVTIESEAISKQDGITQTNDKTNFRRTAQKAVIVDMLMPDSEPVFRDFMGSVASMLIKRGIKTVETWISDNHFLCSLFSKYGFEKAEEPIGIIPTVRLFENTFDINWVNQNFYYTMGDGDLF